MDRFSPDDVRAMRVSEVLTDFRSLCHAMAAIQMNPTPEEYHLHGYAMLRHCIQEAETILAEPFNPGPRPQNEEAQRQQLRAIMLDASVRRFRCQRAFLRARACVTWIHGRYAVTQGVPLHQGHVPLLQQVDTHLLSELAMVTDEQVDYSLRSRDVAQRKWVVEDPPLATILSQIPG